ncbi:MAG: tetratricopeptide repeat protein [Sedimentisphaerales bacterium]|nr:tetratricopeptide repeat protein [Sedimentisphaerales bacterium]
MDFDDMIFHSYDDAEHKAHRAYELYEDGDIAQALLELENAIAINPSNGTWHFNKALALDSMNRFEEAIEEYNTALELNPSDVEILNSLAVDYTRTGFYDKAIELFDEAQQIDPMFEPCYCNRIITYTEMEKHDLAEQMFYLAQQIDPDCPICYYNIGNSLFIRRQYKKAISCWQKTAELESTHPQINFRIAQAYWADGNIEKAKEYFLKELRNNPGDVDVIGEFGLLLLEMNELDSAKEKFNRILEFEPDNATASFYLGEITLNDGDTEKAIQFYKEAVQKDNNIQGARLRIAQIALAESNYENALYYLGHELQFKPQNPDVLVAMASMYLEMGQIDEAGRCLLMATDLDYAHPYAHYYLGICCAIKERYEDAAEFFLHVLDCDNNNPDALLALAKVYTITGRDEKAAQMIEQIKDACGDSSALKSLRQIIRNSRFNSKIKTVSDTVKSVLLKNT